MTTSPPRNPENQTLIAEHVSWMTISRFSATTIRERARLLRTVPFVLPGTLPDAMGWLAERSEKLHPNSLVKIAGALSKSCGWVFDSRHNSAISRLQKIHAAMPNAIGSEEVTKSETRDARVPTLDARRPSYRTIASRLSRAGPASFRRELRRPALKPTCVNLDILGMNSWHGQLTVVPVVGRAGRKQSQLSVMISRKFDINARRMAHIERRTTEFSVEIVIVRRRHWENLVPA